MQNNSVFIASYPRSGNTLTRTILWHCFGLRSASIYPNDLGNNKALEDKVGHIEHVNGQMVFPAGVSHRPIKTHEHDRYVGFPAIYIVWDGRAACSSLFKFSNGSMPMDVIIRGEHMFGSWARHLVSWQPETRQGTLFLRFESIIEDISRTVEELSDFLKLPDRHTSIPGRSNLSDGKWINPAHTPRAGFNEDQVRLFEKVNGPAMIRYGYL